ncbi:MAG: HAD-IA family hydrolase [Candidatus Parvarchaeota archaeon]|nr:HAD-IA family hydrolase [Candidatus Jingweiarchaeum tengchongense]MCW1297759.1 HAD-IA family hydrolase [Candidatus Jingweiarchaeum tengchongense]MCW1299769.1 HAD-IA family hydrolase [Candidatus Jingweiarchaeum tengchongense]MCW1304260.1 HAD-IA family hydrolase [Candidatus Jingweiarchaeum tengchongense]MCW1305288.1 HAD-IA family hydrolase [Candidatus Jingweiarchaeum tengchongense]
MKYKLIIFDLDGTLYRIPKEISERFEDNIIDFYAENFCVSREDARKIRKKLKKKYGTSAYVFKALGMENDFYLSVFGGIDPSTYIKKDEKLVEILNEIKLKKVILTNSPKFFALKVLNAIGIDADTFDLIVTADNCEKIKPDREAFLNITKKFNISPLETIVVGDEAEKDLKMAHELGMKTVLVGRKKAPYIDFNISSIHQIRSVLEHITKSL